jgi:hypothetical protein
LLDQTGAVIGTIVAKLNAINIAKLTGDIPQNVNFAIMGSIVRAFLDVNDITYSISEEASELSGAEIAEMAQGFTVPIECYK